MGVQLQPLVDALKAELLAFPVLHADETPVAMLDPADLEALVRPIKTVKMIDENTGGTLGALIVLNK